MTARPVGKAHGIKKKKSWHICEISMWYRIQGNQRRMMRLPNDWL